MKTILIVDDEKHMLRMIEYTLAVLGCRILSAGSGEEALRLVPHFPIDLAIVDLMLPGIDGFETVQMLREQAEYRDLPVIILTARGLGDLEEKASLAQVLLMTKPFSPMELRRVALARLERKEMTDPLSDSSNRDDG